MDHVVGHNVISSMEFVLVDVHTFKSLNFVYKFLA